MASVGPVVILNGAPRSGKSSIAVAMDTLDTRPWLNIGVDSTMADLAPNQRPGLGLRPGGERPDLEHLVLDGYRQLFEAVEHKAAAGTAVAVDVGVHDWFSEPLGLWSEIAARLVGVPAFVVGVRCDLPVILARRSAAPQRGVTRYETTASPPVLRWQEAVHNPGRYDLEVDTSSASAPQCAEVILRYVASGAPVALAGWRAEDGLNDPDR